MKKRNLNLPILLTGLGFILVILLLVFMSVQFRGMMKNYGSFSTALYAEHMEKLSNSRLLDMSEYMEEVKANEAILQEQENEITQRIVITFVAAFIIVVVLMACLLWLNKTSVMTTVNQMENTFRAETEERTRANERVSLMLNATPLACTLRDKDFKIFDCNEEAVRLFKLKDKRDFIERFQQCSPEYQPNGRLSSELAGEYIRKAYEEGKCVFEWQHQTIDGTLFPAEITIIRVGTGSDYSTMGYTRDLREQKRMMKEVETAVNSLESILNSIDAMIYASVPDTGELLFVNDYMKEAFGKSGEELVGAYCYEVFRGIDKMCEFCPCHRLDEETESVIVWEEFEFSQKRHVRHFDCYIDWPNGEKVHLQHAIDITELVNAREMAEQSNRSKGVFLAQMSHEIRTPMNAILGISEIYLRDKQLSSHAAEGFRKIYDSGNLLLHIINDILDFSKIDAGKMEIIPDKYDIPSLVNDTVQLCRLRYESKPIEFTLQIDENTPLELIGDELRIRQVLNNLLSNAFKYTDAGEVELSVAAEPGQDDDTVTLVFQVSDTGQGMKPDQLERLFQEYERFNMETNRGISGTGLGLNITKRLIDMMGGGIAVESTVGKGSVFTVRLPQKTCGPVLCGPDIAESLRDFNYDMSITKKTQIAYEPMPYGQVLIVDDVESNLYVAKGLMLPYELHIDLAKSGFDAIEIIKSGKVYDVVFMDHMMPKMDGMKTTKIIRDMGYTHPIVALTANAISGQSEIFLANGFDGFISKPIDSRELDMFLINLIRDKKPPEMIEQARRERREAAAPKKELTELEKYFLMDAENIMPALSAMCAMGPALDGGDMDDYITAAHGIKSALANIGEKKLSGFAFELEQAGKARDLDGIAGKTPAFIQELQALTEELKLRGRL